MGTATGGDNMIVECSVCGKSCASQAALEAHHRQGAHANDFYCFVCDTFFTTEVEISSHNIEQHRNISITCDGCACVFLKGYTYKKHYDGCKPPEEQHVCFEYGCGFSGTKAEVNRHWEKIHQADAIAAEAYYTMRKAEKAAEAKKAFNSDLFPETIIGNIENKHKTDHKTMAPPAPKPIHAALGFVDTRPIGTFRLLAKPSGSNVSLEQQYCRPFSFPMDEPTSKLSIVEKPKAPAPPVAIKSKPFVMPPRPPTPPSKYGPGSRPRPMSNVEMKAPNDVSNRPRTVRHNHALSAAASLSAGPPPVRSTPPSQPKQISSRKPFCCLCTKEYEDWLAFDEHWSEKHPNVQRNPGVPADHVPMVNGKRQFDRSNRPGPPDRNKSSFSGTRQFGPQCRQSFEVSGSGTYPAQNGPVLAGRDESEKKAVHLADQVKELLRKKALKQTQEVAMAKLKERMQNFNGKLPERQQKAQDSAPPTPLKGATATGKPEGCAVATLDVPQDELRKALNIPKTMKAEVVLRELPGYGTKVIKKETTEDIKKKVAAGEPLPIHLAIQMAAEKLKAKTEAQQEYIPTLREQYRFLQGRPRDINWEEDEDVYVTEEVAKANGLPVSTKRANYGNDQTYGSVGVWGNYSGTADVARPNAQSELINQPSTDAAQSSFAVYGADLMAQLDAQAGVHQTTSGPESVSESVAAPISGPSITSSSTIFIPPILAGDAGKLMFVALPEEERPKPQADFAASAGAKQKSAILFGKRK